MVCWLDCIAILSAVPQGVLQYKREEAGLRPCHDTNFVS